MKVYIPPIDFHNFNKKSLFILTRPFLGNYAWENESEERLRFSIPDTVVYTASLENADVYFIPLPIQFYSKKALQEINSSCQHYYLKAYGYIQNDFGPDLGTYENIVFYRMGGFKSQLSENNLGFPVMLSDHFQRIYNTTQIEVRAKQAKPVVGFCGHASFNRIKQFKEILKCVVENLKRFFEKPIRKDFEPLFASAFQRASLLNHFEKSDQISTNFVYRENYRGGAKTDSERGKTTLEYYDNIKNSDYVLCVRGAGNFSVRLYETLMMGRIPIFVNTDCLLPFENEIDWKQHVVWVEWKDRHKIAQFVAHFHQNVSEEDFKTLQSENRKLWQNLQVAEIYKYIRNEIK